jgi:hypothetical protein
MTIMMPPHAKWSCGAGPSLLLGAVLVMVTGTAASQTGPATFSAPAPAGAPGGAGSRSAVFDIAKADELRLRQQPAYVESIVVEGRDPDGPRTRRRSLEQTFAEVLLAAPPAAAMGMRKLNATPCHAVQSSLNTIGSSYAPLTGCPGYTNSP